MTFKIEDNTVQGLKNRIFEAVVGNKDDLLPLLDEWDRSCRPIESASCISLLDEDESGPATEAFFRGNDELGNALQERGRIRYNNKNAYGRNTSLRYEGS